jgi:hypothetical protein
MRPARESATLGNDELRSGIALHNIEYQTKAKAKALKVETTGFRIY